MINGFRSIFALTLVLLCGSLWGASGKPPDPLFQSDETLDVTITAPISTLMRERPKDDFLPGVVRFTNSDGSELEAEAEISTRGHFRHKTCDFPPVWLNFKRGEVKGTLLDNQNKLKLVVHCDDPKRYEQTVLREYLAYRILNVITDMSFRVRLLRVTYVDTDGKRDDQLRYAFLIEHKNRLGDRYDLEDLKIERTALSAIQADRLNLTSIFEYLIGNTDFSPIAGAPGDDCCHNYVLFGNAADPIVAIPYDFDQSGFVDAPYAAPNPNFRIRTVRQRLYRGRCVNNGHIEASLQRFRDRREEIYALVAAQEGLDDGIRKRVTRYIDDFYEIINDPKTLQKRIIDRCI